MSACRELDRVLAAEGLPAEARQAAMDHAAACAECGAAMALLGGAAQALRSAPPPSIDRGARMRIWSGVAADRRRPSVTRPWTLAAGVAVAAAVALGLFHLPAREAPVEPATIVAGALEPLEGPPSIGSAPVGRWARAPLESRAKVGPADVRLDLGSVVMIAPDAADLRLFRGRARLSVAKLAPTEAFEVTTPLARVKVIGTRFSVEATGDRTRVQVEEGTVWVFEGDEPEPRVLTAGQSFEVRAPEAVLSEARALLESDAGGAARIAAALVEGDSPPAVEVEALLVMADAERRRGDPGRAAALYLRVVDHPSGEPYSEEAWLKTAELRHAIGDRHGALGALIAAEKRVGEGVLGPERARLEAEIHRQAGDRARAALSLKLGADRARSAGDEGTARSFEVELGRLR